jgi:hypothetical protein
LLLHNTTRHSQPHRRRRRRKNKKKLQDCAARGNGKKKDKKRNKKNMMIFTVEKRRRDKELTNEERTKTNKKNKNMHKINLVTKPTYVYEEIIILPQKTHRKCTDALLVWVRRGKRFLFQLCFKLENLKDVENFAQI